MFCSQVSAERSRRMSCLEEQREKIVEYISNLLHESFGVKADYVTVSFNSTFMTVYKELHISFRKSAVRRRQRNAGL